MHALLLAATLALVQTPADTSYLYKILLVRAAPGQLLELIDAYKERSIAYEEAGDGPVHIMRHSQGDHWDLFLVFPMESFEAYYAADRVRRRSQAFERTGMSAQAFEHELGPLVAWREELFAKGPPLDVVSSTMREAGYYHVEMFVALPGKRAELFREREMENAYLAQIDRPQNMIFTRVGGAAWDSFTLGAYRDLKHYAESADVPEERQQAAALAAGFDGADRIGTYLRTLIQRHNDTLGGPVRE